jgi:hypothetical protein
VVAFRTKTFGGKPVDLRVSTIPTQYGESVVLRILDKSVVNLDLNSLGIDEIILQQIRKIISLPNGIFIVTGPILNNRLVNKIGREHQITVPEYFFKAVVDTNKMGTGIAFVMKNQGSQLPLKTFVITIDSLERLTGRNFYSQIPQKKQDKIEKTVHFEHWDLND